jgi:hypothetical protein
MAVLAAVRALGVMGILAVIAFATAPAATAAINVEDVETNPSTTAAGGHPNMAINLDLSYTGEDDLRNLTLRLPTGFLGNPSAADLCSIAQFESEACSPDSEVGSTSVTAQATSALLPVPVPVTSNGTVYNLEPQPGEPARLGIIVDPSLPALFTADEKIFLQSPIEVRDHSDFGLTSRVRNMPRQVSGTLLLGLIPATLDLEITSLSFTLNGTAANGPFTTNPTTCLPASTTASVTSYDGSSDSATASFTPTDCDGVPFDPSAKITPETTQVDAPSGYTITLSMPEGGSRQQSHVQRTEVLLPPGVVFSPGISNGLQACTDAQFGLGNTNAPNCPAGSDIGDVTFDTPVVGKLTGHVYLGEPKPGNPYRILVGVPGPGLIVKLQADTLADPQTGRLRTIFEDLPQVPFTDFELTFRGGPSAVLVTPQECGTHRLRATVTPWSAAPDFDADRNARPSATFSTSFDGAGAPCPEHLFQPGVANAMSTTQAGANPAQTLTVSRPDRHERLHAMEVALPPGLLGRLDVPRCPEPQASIGNCPAESKVGTVRAASGPGSAPLVLNGDVFITDGIDGSLLGLTIAIPANVGPFTHLGTVVSRAGLFVDSSKAQVTVRSRPFPQIVGGIPLALREIALTLDRPGFLVNPTNCSPMQFTGAFTSVEGTTAGGTAPFQATGCENLGFAPRASGRIGAAGQTGPAGQPPLSTVVGQGLGEANSSAVTVSLPPAVGPNVQSILSKVCPAEQVQTGACPASSQVGTATVLTRVSPQMLSGPVYVAQVPGQNLPGLSIELGGFTSMRLIGTNSLEGGRVSTTFANLPDIPLEAFALNLNGGADGLLQNFRDICNPSESRGVLVHGISHAGTTSTIETDLDVNGCGAGSGGGPGGGGGGNNPGATQSLRPRTNVSLRAFRRGRRVHRATLGVRVRRRAGQPRIRQVRVRLPKGMAVPRGRKKLNRALTTRADRRRLPDRLGRRLNRRDLRVRARTLRRGHADLKVTLAQIGVKRALGRRMTRPRVRQRPRLPVQVRVTYVNGRTATFTVRVRGQLRTLRRR